MAASTRWNGETGNGPSLPSTRFPRHPTKQLYGYPANSSTISAQKATPTPKQCAARSRSPTSTRTRTSPSSTLPPRQELRPARGRLDQGPPQARARGCLTAPGSAGSSAAARRSRCPGRERRPRSVIKVLNFPERGGDPASLAGMKRTRAGTDRRAKAVCGECPVRRPCLEFALDHDLVHGIWGGTTPQDRQAWRGGRRPEPFRTVS